MKPRVAALALIIAFPLLLGVRSGELTAIQPVPSWPPDNWTVDSMNPSLRWHGEGYTQIIVLAQGSSVPIVEAVVPKGQDSYAITATLQAGTLYRWRLRTNPYPPSQNVYTWSAWSPESSFKTPGGAPPPPAPPVLVSPSPSPSVAPPIVVPSPAPSAPPSPAIVPAPSNLPSAIPIPPSFVAPPLPSASWSDGARVLLIAPRDGAVAPAIAPTLSWTPPAGSTMYEMMIWPRGNESGLVRFVNKISSNFPIPAAPSWYGMLPDTEYVWRVRVTNASQPVLPDHSSWGPWSETWAFRTPVPSSELISAVSPKPGTAADSNTPTLTWKNTDEQVFFYEVQVSKDPAFTTDPSRAVAPVYWELRHGGLTTPENSYAVSGKYPLDKRSLYYWRVRPALPQGATPAAWSPAWSFLAP